MTTLSLNRRAGKGHQGTLAGFPLIHHSINTLPLCACEPDRKPSMRYGSNWPHSIPVKATRVSSGDSPRCTVFGFRLVGNSDEDAVVRDGLANHGRRPDRRIRLARLVDQLYSNDGQVEPPRSDNCFAVSRLSAVRA